MAPGLDCPASATDEHHREVVVLMFVAVGQAAPVQDHGVVEQCAVAIRRPRQFADKFAEQLHVVAIDPAHLFDQIGIALMMC